MSVKTMSISGALFMFDNILVTLSPCKLWFNHRKRVMSSSRKPKINYSKVELVFRQ